MAITVLFYIKPLYKEENRGNANPSTLLAQRSAKARHVVVASIVYRRYMCIISHRRDTAREAKSSNIINIFSRRVRSRK